MNKEIFRKQLVDARHKAGLTQKELGKELCVDQAVISRWESGKELPTLANLEKLCTLFGLTPQEFGMEDKTIIEKESGDVIDNENTHAENQVEDYTGAIKPPIVQQSDLSEIRDDTVETVGSALLETEGGLKNGLSQVNCETVVDTKVVEMPNHGSHKSYYFFMWLFLLTGTYTLMGILGVLCFLVPVRMSHVPPTPLFVGVIPASVIAVYSILRIRHLPSECIPERKPRANMPSNQEFFKKLEKYGAILMGGVCVVLFGSPRMFVDGVDFWDVYIIPFLSLLVFVFFAVLHISVMDDSAFTKDFENPV